MLHRVFLPQLGQTMEEGTIERWHKQEGERVERGEVLYELTTDKATLEVEAYAEGVLRKILAPEGATVEVNHLVAVIGEEGEEIPPEMLEATAEPEETGEAAPTPAAAEEGKEEPEEQAPPPAGEIRSSPRARKLAREREIPLEVLRGSGPGGRIIERDVLEYDERLSGVRATPTARRLAYQRAVDLVSVAREVGDHRVRKADVPEAPEAAPAGEEPGRRVALSPMRSTIAERMAESKQTVPHFYLMGELRADRAMELRERLGAKEGRKVTLTALLVKATGLALREHPRVNARFDGDAVVLNERCSVGVAVAVEDGLFVPVVRDADRKNLPTIAGELTSLAESARAGQLLPRDYEGGSITISNLGMYGVDYFQAIINPPESCIIGVGRAKPQVVAEDGEPAVATVMKLSLSADHRVIDGAEAAEFFRTLRELLEEPERLTEPPCSEGIR